MVDHGENHDSKSMNIYCNWGYLTSKISHSSKKCEIKCLESRKKLTAEYKFCLMDAEAKCPG